MTTVRHIPVGNPGPMTGLGNNTWLLDGASPTLIDAGVGQAQHLDAIADALGGRALERVLVTHGHADHSSGVPAIKARWPGVVVHGWATDGSEPWAPLQEGQGFRVGDRTLAVLHTPGHAPDHVCFWDVTTRELFVGDMLVQGSTVMIPAGRGGHLGHYLASLARLAALAPVRAYPGHGAVIEDPVALIAEYVSHRAQRETQVRACLAAGMTAVDEIVERIYGPLIEPVRAAATATVLAHLEKLRGDGRL